MSDAAGVRELVTRFVEAMDQGDMETAARLHSSADDSLAIGTDPEEWWRGGEDVQQAFREQGEGGLKVRVEDPLVGAEGDIGWYAARGAFVLPDGRMVAFRATGVCRREGGEWKIFQSHTSLPVPNEEALVTP